MSFASWDTFEVLKWLLSDLILMSAVKNFSCIDLLMLKKLNKYYIIYILYNQDSNFWHISKSMNEIMQHKFTIRCPVKMTWSTHKFKLWIWTSFYFSTIFFFFVTEEIPITISRRAPDKEAWPSPYISLLFLTLALSSHQHRTLVCLFWPGILDCAHSPANPTAARQECFELLDVSNSSNCSFSNT